MTTLLYLLLRLALLTDNAMAAAEKPDGSIIFTARAQTALSRAVERSDAAEARLEARTATCTRLERWRTNVRHFGGSIWWALAGFTSDVVGVVLTYLHAGAVREVIEAVSERWSS